MAADLNAEPGSEITSTELDYLTAKLLAGVSDSLSSIVLALDDDDNALMVRLAYHDELELSLIEDKVRRAIVDRGDGEPTARKFTLNRYRKAAREQRRRFEEAKLLRAKMALRNGKIEDNAKPDEEVQRVMDASPDRNTQEKLYSNSTYLRSIGLLEAHRKGRVWWCDFHQDIMTDWDGSSDDRVLPPRTVDDGFILACWQWMAMLDTKLATGGSDSSTRNALRHFANQDHRNEARDWLKSLSWDNTPRLSSWLNNVYGVDDDEYYRAVGRCWLVSMAARMMKPGCKVDTMPVLIGPQGTGKSRSVDAIGGKWAGTISTNANKQEDFLLSLQGLVLGEIAELDAIRGTANTRVKALLSTPWDRFRRPYGHGMERFDRTCVLVGSTNEKGWHKDETGGRRFWPIQCNGKIDVQWILDNREQLFAEARVLYEGGGSWWDVPEAEQHLRVMDHFTSDPWEEKIANWISANELWTGARGQDVEKIFPDLTSGDGAKYWGTMITTNRVLGECLMMPPERWNKTHANKVGQIMDHLGYTLRAVRDTNGRGGRVMKAWRVTHICSASEETIQQLSLLSNHIDDQDGV